MMGVRAGSWLRRGRPRMIVSPTLRRAKEAPLDTATLFDLSGATALVTGASSGLGWRFVRVLASSGANVVAVARRAERLEALVALIKTNGGSALAVEADVVARPQVVDAFDRAEAVFGKVTVLVNNAGVAAPASFLGMKN